MSSRSHEGWTRVAFGDVVRLGRARSSAPLRDGFDRYVGLDHLDGGDLRVRRWGDVANGTTFTTVFRAGQVLFGKRRAYQRKVAVPDFDGVCSGDIYVFEPANDALLAALLPFICQTDAFFEHAVGTSAGSLSPRTNWDSLARYAFALPPIEEQRRIVEALDATDRVIESVDRMAVSLSQARDAVVAGFVSRAARESAAALSEHADVRYGLTVDPQRRDSIDQVPYLRVANVQRDTFDLSDIKQVGTGPGDEMYRLLDRDVLVVEGHADPREIGRAAIWRADGEAMYHQNHLIRVRCRPSLDPEFLCLLLNSTHGRSYFRRHAKSTSGLSTINSSVVKQYRLPVPAVATQQRLIDLARGGVTAPMIDSRAAASRALRSSLLGSMDGGGVP